MILEIYVSLFALSLFILYIGYYGKIEVVKVLAFGLLFVLGGVMLGYVENIEYKSGETLNNNMACGGCVDSRLSNSTNATNIYLASTVSTNIYSEYSNQTLGFLICVLSFLGWLSVYFDLRARGGNN